MDGLKLMTFSVHKPSHLCSFSVSYRIHGINGEVSHHCHRDQCDLCGFPNKPRLEAFVVAFFREATSSLRATSSWLQRAAMDCLQRRHWFVLVFMGTGRAVLRSVWGTPHV